MSNEWNKPASPPPPMFVGQPERNFVKQIHDEITEKVVGQVIAYYAIDKLRTNYHPLYGEAIIKEFFPPIKVNVTAEWDGSQTKVSGEGIDRKTRVKIFFHKRRITEDQNIEVREGDFIFYGSNYYKILKVYEPIELWAQNNYRFQIVAECLVAREGEFDGI